MTWAKVIETLVFTFVGLMLAVASGSALLLAWVLWNLSIQ